MLPILWQPLKVLAMFSGPTGFLLRTLLYLRLLRPVADGRPGRGDVRIPTAISRVQSVPPETSLHRSPPLPRWERWRAAGTLFRPSAGAMGRPSPGDARALLRRELARVNGQPLHVSPRFFRRMGLSEPAGALLLSEAARELGLSVQCFGARGCWEVRGPANARAADSSVSSLSPTGP